MALNPEAENASIVTDADVETTGHAIQP